MSSSRCVVLLLPLRKASCKGFSRCSWSPPLSLRFLPNRILFASPQPMNPLPFCRYLPSQTRIPEKSTCFNRDRLRLKRHACCSVSGILYSYRLVGLLEMFFFRFSSLSSIILVCQKLIVFGNHPPSLFPPRRLPCFPTLCF